ncbi:MAG: hypothetical protein LJE96_03035 [Deltaproteobacteria bacterium]|jgi:DNA-binding NtrC family response regulator|nr:hypothetical protein [Deltaproteobacteria bacterium]
MANVLIVESYPNLAFLYREILSDDGHQVFVTPSCKEAKDIAQNNDIDLVLIDKSSPDNCAEKLLRTIKTIQPRINAILCPLDKFSQKSYRELCDESFLKTSNYSILQEKISELAEKAVRNRKNFQNPSVPFAN